jgi:hypothetical protein
MNAVHLREARLSPAVGTLPKEAELSRRAGTVVPATAWRVEIDAFEQGQEGGAIQRDLGRLRGQGRKLKGAAFEALLPDAPARGIKIEEFEKAAIAGEKEIELAIQGVEAQSAHPARQCMKGAAQIHGVNGQKDTSTGRET